MKKLAVFLALVASLSLAGCGASTRTRTKVSSPPPLSQSDSVQVDEKTEVECRWITPTGSNMRRRVCKSRFEWEMEKQSAKDFLQRPRSGPQVGQ